MRMQASIAVSLDRSAWLLVNATTDVRRQLEQLPIPPGNAQRSTPVSAVLLTDANIDHAAGLLDLRQARSLQIISSGVVREALVDRNAMFAPLARGERTWSAFGPEEKMAEVPRVIPGLRVIAIDVPGLLPSYAGSAEVSGAATAYMFEERVGRRLFTRMLYAPVFFRMSQALLAATDECEALFLDGSFWTDDELASLGLGTRSAREMGHAPISGDGGWLREMDGRAAAADTRRFCTHVNNSNPILDPRSVAARALREASFSIAADGMEIVLDGGG
jgi:pyrroloquinoline quinone biosynthesis protein B